MASPQHPGSGYVLLHHVMGELEGNKGAWAYVQGGMGGVSQAIANCAMDHGAAIFCSKPVSQIVTDSSKVKGVVLEDGTEIRAKAVLSNATAKITYLDLLPKGSLSTDLTDEISHLDYSSPVTKINVAVDRIPNFTANPNSQKNEPMPHHQCTIHLNCEDSNLIHGAYLDAQMGKITERPMIEMVIPSTLDPTLCKPGHHVVLLFTQYTPYKLAEGEWDDENRNKYADIVFDTIERYAPGFKDSVIGRDILTPPDLEATFGLTGGNIFHGSMSLDQLYLSRPTPALASYKCPSLSGMYLCGSGAHPGGGVMGAPGRLSAKAVLADFKSLA